MSTTEPEPKPEGDNAKGNEVSGAGGKEVGGDDGGRCNFKLTGQA